MEYKIITEDRFEEAIQHLYEFFFMDEPVHKAVGLCKPGERNLRLEKYLKKILSKKLSIMALNENDEIVGVRLNDVIHRDYITILEKAREKTSDENLKKVLGFFNELNRRAQIFDRFNVDEIFDLCMISVNKRYRGKGIGKEMIQITEKLARDLGFTLMKVEATGIYSQNILRSNGFKVLNELYYDRWCDVFGNPIFKVESPHVKSQLMYKELN